MLIKAMIEFCFEKTRKAALGAAFLAIFSAQFFGCCFDEETQGKDSAEDGNVDHVSSMGSVILHGTGTIIKVDVGNMTAIVQMHDSGIYANEEVTFDFRKHTESQPVELDRCKPGDEVKVTYFDSQTSNGGLAGESLVLAEATSGL